MPALGLTPRRKQKRGQLVSSPTVAVRWPSKVAAESTEGIGQVIPVDISLDRPGMCLKRS